MKTKKQEESFSDNPGNNIVGLFGVLLNFPFTTSEKKCDY